MLGANAVDREQQGLAGAKAAVQQDMEQHVVAKAFGLASKRVPLTLGAKDDVEVLEDATRKRTKCLLACWWCPCHLLDPALEVLQPVAKVIDILQLSAGGGNAAHGAEHESACRHPATARGALFDRGQVVLSDQEGLERARQRFDVQIDQEPIEHIGSVDGLDMDIKRVDAGERVPARVRRQRHHLGEIVDGCPEARNLVGADGNTGAQRGWDQRASDAVD